MSAPGRSLALTGDEVAKLRAYLARAQPGGGDDADQAVWELVGYLEATLEQAEAGGWVSGACR